MTSDVEGEEKQTSAVEDKVMELTHLVVEEEKDKIIGVEMTGTTLEAVIGIRAASMMANGVITTITTANGEITITMDNGEIIITARAPQETSGAYRIPSQPSCIQKQTPRWYAQWDLS